MINPTISQLEESEIDLVVSGTRDAIMMVEAGAKIVPESVMAEAIMFAHRSLAPIIDLQEQLRAQVGKAKRLPFIEPGTDSVLEFVEPLQSDQPFVVFDVETTSRDAKQGSIVEIGAVKVQGGKIADKWSTLVNPGSAIVGKQLHGITDADVKSAPAPAEAAQKFFDWAGDASWSATTSASTSVSSMPPLGDRSKHRAAGRSSTRSSDQGGLPGQRPQAGRPGQVLRAQRRAHASRAARRRGDGGAAAAHRPGPARPHRHFKHTVADAIRAMKGAGSEGGDKKTTGSATRRAGRLVLEEPRRRCCTRRSSASWC